MTIGVGFNNPNYNSKYGSENIRRQINTGTEVDSLPKKRKSSNKSEASSLIGAIGLTIGAIFAFKKRGKIKEALPVLKNAWGKAKSCVTENFPKAVEGCKNLGKNVITKIGELIKKKA